MCKIINELRFLCCDIFYLLELTQKTQVFKRKNTVGISSNDKYMLLLLLQLVFKVPSISTLAGEYEYATDSLPHKWCDPSRTTPLSVAPSSGWRHVNTQVAMLETALFSTIFL